MTAMSNNKIKRKKKQTIKQKLSRTKTDELNKRNKLGLSDHRVNMREFFLPNKHAAIPYPDEISFDEDLKLIPDIIVEFCGEYSDWMTTPLYVIDRNESSSMTWAPWCRYFRELLVMKYGDFEVAEPRFIFLMHSIFTQRMNSIFDEDL
jgi:hypothetical protein